MKDKAKWEEFESFLKKKAIEYNDERPYLEEYLEKIEQFRKLKPKIISSAQTILDAIEFGSDIFWSAIWGGLSVMRDGKRELLLQLGEYSTQDEKMTFRDGLLALIEGLKHDDSVFTDDRLKRRSKGRRTPTSERAFLYGIEERYFRIFQRTGSLSLHGKYIPALQKTFERIGIYLEPESLQKRIRKTRSDQKAWRKRMFDICAPCDKERWVIPDDCPRHCKLGLKGNPFEGLHYYADPPHGGRCFFPWEFWDLSELPSNKAKRGN